ncbi:MAG TPA: VTT domain-containing protein [Dongiaceae bacterium]|nr:VTT domain-containing protein [Dongiaceae bacterium]
MHSVLHFVMKHGYSVLFGGLLAQHLGLPIPGPLFLLAAAALAATGRMGVAAALILAVLACVLGDWAWYEAGRREGDKVLHFIHRLTRDPDAHNEKAKATFARYGSALLVIADFVPALDAVTPPLAGMSRITRLRFLTFDGVGAGLYSSAYFALGYVFSDDLDRAAAYVGRAGTAFAALLIAALLILGGRHLLRRYRLTYEFGSRGGHDLIRLNLKPSVGNDFRISGETRI